MTVAEYLTACGGLVTPPGVPAINGLPTAATLGLTMRDYFAAAALTGIMQGAYGDEDGNVTYPDVMTAADHAYQQADAMLAERAKIVG